MKWRKLRSVFRKRKLKSILAVEYTINRTIIRATNQIKVEEAIMQENVSRFLLAYSLPIFFNRNHYKNWYFRLIRIFSEFDIS